MKSQFLQTVWWHISDKDAGNIWKLIKPRLPRASRSRRAGTEICGRRGAGAAACDFGPSSPRASSSLHSQGPLRALHFTPLSVSSVRFVFYTSLLHWQSVNRYVQVKNLGDITQNSIIFLRDSCLHRTLLKVDSDLQCKLKNCTCCSYVHVV